MKLELSYEISTDQGKTWLPTDSTDSHTFKDLTFEFMLRAINAVGKGEAVTISLAVTDGSVTTHYGQCGPNVTWTLIGDSLTLIGEGGTWEWTPGLKPSYFRWNNAIANITIPGSITRLGNWSFSSLSNPVEVTMDPEKTTLGDYVFKNSNVTFKELEEEG